MLQKELKELDKSQKILEKALIKVIKKIIKGNIIPKYINISLNNNMFSFVSIVHNSSLLYLA